jgi:hypothetical protein
LGVICSCFSRCLRCIIRLFFEKPLVFNVGTYSYKHSPQYGLCCVPQILVGCIFILLGSKNFFIYSLISLLTNWSFGNALCSLHVCEYFLWFLLLLRSDIIQGLFLFP